MHSTTGRATRSLPRSSAECSTWLAGNPQHRFGRPSYDLAWFGVSRADPEPMFDAYISALDVELEGDS